MASDRPSRQLHTRRLEALVDGVFAIAITLLVIEIKVPVVHSDEGVSLTEALIDLWPSYLAYGVTFFVVGAYWINHHRMFFLLRGVDHTFLILNIFFLMAIAIVPFPNAVLAEYVMEPEQRGAATALYGLAMTTLAIIFNLVWRYADRKGLFRPEVERPKIHGVLRSYAFGPVLFLAGTIVAVWQPIPVLVMFLVVPLGYLFEGPVAQIDEGYLGDGD